MHKHVAALMLGLILAPLSHAADAEGERVLREFLAGVQTLRADFEQQVTDSRGELVEASSGEVQMSRPGRFRWEYHTPWERTIVADGVNVWLYEPDLEQVTTRKLDSGSLMDTPAALLTGEADVLDRFDIVRSSEQQGVLWIRLEPRLAESDFVYVQLAFVAGRLFGLEIGDRLGQTTGVRFDALEVNPLLAADAFIFEVPPGADVIGDGDI